MSNQAEIYQSQVIHFSQKHWKTLHTKKTPLEKRRGAVKVSHFWDKIPRVCRSAVQTSELLTEWIS